MSVIFFGMLSSFVLMTTETDLRDRKVKKKQFES